MAGDTGDLNLAEQFLAAYRARDWTLLRTLLTDDVTWTMPGTGSISGTVRGKDAVVLRIEAIVGRGVKTELLHILVGQTKVALSLHNTAEDAGGGRLDEHLVTALTLRDGRIAVLDSLLSDVDGMSTFFNG